MSTPTIVVIGSSNTNMVIKTTLLPQPGETILGGGFYMTPGDKGANQAVAAARRGGSVIFLQKLETTFLVSRHKPCLKRKALTPRMF